MIDLDRIMNKSYQFMLGGSLINVSQPSIKMVRDFNSAISDDSETHDIFGVQVDFVTKLLNNNTSARKFKPSDVEKFPQEVLGKIIDVVANGIEEAEENPN